MLATAGILVQGIIRPEVNFMTAGEKAIENSGASFGTLLVIQIILMGFAEGRRWQDIRKPGSTSEPAGNFFGLEKALGGNDDLGYPGGAFDPMGFYKGSVFQLNELKLKELKNGRLGMLAYVGISCAYVSTGMGPIEALQYHLSDPWSHSVVSSTYAVPI